MTPDQVHEALVNATIVADANDTWRGNDLWVMRLRLGLRTPKPLTLEETGRQLGITRERVRQIEASIVRRVFPDGERADERGGGDE